MRSLLRDRWPVGVGLAAGGVVIAVFGLAGVGDAANWRRSVLGVPPGAWALALSVLCVFLGLQLFVNARTSFLRERRLVHSAAALREATAQLERLATTDELTGMPNRRAFFERFGIEFRRSLRYGRGLSVVMLDLDDFKEINDRFGHPVGDAVLRTTAAIVRASIRESDVLARYGGEELVVMLPETSRADAVTVAEKLRDAVAQHDFAAGPPGGPPIRLTLSAGIAGLPMDGPVTSEDLVTRADRALYEAKGGGKNRVCVDDGHVVPGAGA